MFYFYCQNRHKNKCLWPLESATTDSMGNSDYGLHACLQWSLQGAIFESSIPIIDNIALLLAGNCTPFRTCLRKVQFARGLSSDWNTLLALKPTKQKFKGQHVPFLADVDDALVKIIHVMDFDFCILADIQWENKPIHKMVFTVECNSLVFCQWNMHGSSHPVIRQPQYRRYICCMACCTCWTWWIETSMHKKSTRQKSPLIDPNSLMLIRTNVIVHWN